MKESVGGIRTANEFAKDRGAAGAAGGKGAWGSRLKSALKPAQKRMQEMLDTWMTVGQSFISYVKGNGVSADGATDGSSPVLESALGLGSADLDLDDVFEQKIWLLFEGETLMAPYYPTPSLAARVLAKVTWGGLMYLSRSTCMTVDSLVRLGPSAEFRQSLVRTNSTRFNLLVYSAENSTKISPVWGRLDYGLFLRVSLNCLSLMKCLIVYLIIVLTSSIYVLRSTLRHLTRWRSRIWWTHFLTLGDRTIRACQLDLQCHARKLRLNPQTQPTYVLDQPSISNGPLSSRGRLPI